MIRNFKSFWAPKVLVEPLNYFDSWVQGGLKRSTLPLLLFLLLAEGNIFYLKLLLNTHKYLTVQKATRISHFSFKFIIPLNF